MTAFDFVLLFLSFIYALALTHLLMTAAKMIRYRRTVVFSVPHALWMLVALSFVLGNWLSLWDFHSLTKITATAITAEFAFSVLVYLVCALVSPDFDNDGVNNLRAFHEHQGSAYMGAALVTVVAGVVLNLGAGTSMGLQKWANENALVIAMLVPVIAALAVRRPWVQIAAPLVLAGLTIVYIFAYYPILK